MHALIALLAALLTGCAAAAPKVPSRSPRAWSDDILYFVLVDRFADGDTTNDANVDRKAKGAFHGGDLKGLIANLDEISSVGVTAIWVNPLVKNIEGHVDGAGFPDWAYHGYWADDFTRLDPRFGNPAPSTWPSMFFTRGRSEEHTSELQSRLHLRFRLLL